MNHDCVGNTRLAMGEDEAITVFAANKIESGTPILFNYVSALDTTDTRLRCELQTDPQGNHNPVKTKRKKSHAKWPNHPTALGCLCFDPVLVPLPTNLWDK